MSLRSKIFVLLIAVFGLYAALDYWIQRGIVLPAFKSLEDQDAEADIQRCAEALRHEKISLLDSLNSWLMASESESFLRSRDRESIEQALNAGVLGESRINFMLFADHADQVIWSSTVD